MISLQRNILGYASQLLRHRHRTTLMPAQKRHAGLDGDWASSHRQGHPIRLWSAWPYDLGGMQVMHQIKYKLTMLGVLLNVFSGASQGGVRWPPRNIWRPQFDRWVQNNANAVKVYKFPTDFHSSCHAFLNRTQKRYIFDARCTYAVISYANIKCIKRQHTCVGCSRTEQIDQIDIA